MTEIYSKKYINEIQKSIKKARIYMIIALFITYSIGILLCFLLNDRTYKLLTFLIIMITSIGLFIFLYFLFKDVFPNKKIMKFYKSIDETALEEFKGIVTDISKERTYKENIKIIEVTILNNNKKDVLYMPIEHKNLIKVNSTITCYTFKYFIVKYEVEHE